jgi:hypothetical protein
LKGLPHTSRSLLILVALGCFDSYKIDYSDRSRCREHRVPARPVLHRCQHHEELAGSRENIKANAFHTWKTPAARMAVKGARSLCVHRSVPGFPHELSLRVWDGVSGRSEAESLYGCRSEGYGASQGSRASRTCSRGMGQRGKGPIHPDPLFSTRLRR